MFGLPVNAMNPASSAPLSGKPTPLATEAKTGSDMRARVAWFLNVVGPFLGLLLVIALFSIRPEVRAGFLTGGNFKIIFTQTVIVASCALGMTMIIVSGGIDLSMGSVVALVSVVGAKLLELQSRTPPIIISPFVVAAVMIAAGALVGLVNATLIAGFRMLPFIVTLGMMGIARGTGKWLADNVAVNYDEKSTLNNLMALNEPYSFFQCRSEEHTSELQSQSNLVCRLLLEKKKKIL